MLWFQQPQCDMSHARSVFERCVQQTPGGAAADLQHVGLAGQVQQDNVFKSSVVKLCLRRYSLASLSTDCTSVFNNSVILHHYLINIKKITVYWRLRTDIKGSNVPSLRSVLVVEERMSSALVGDRKDIRPQNLFTSCPSWNGLSLHSSPFTSVPSLSVSQGHAGWDHGAIIRMETV